METRYARPLRLASLGSASSQILTASHWLHSWLLQVKADLQSLSFVYSGPSGTVTVTDKNGNGGGVNNFQVSEGTELEVTALSFCSGAKSSGGSSSCTKFSSSTQFISNGQTTALHTSCSVPIYVGMVIQLGNGGTLTITEFRSDVRRMRFFDTFTSRAHVCHSLFPQHVRPST
jgi:hypothetical protein